MKGMSAEEMKSRIALKRWKRKDENIEIEKQAKGLHIPYNHKAFDGLRDEVVASAQYTSGPNRVGKDHNDVMYRLNMPKVHILKTGVEMEKVENLLRTVNEEVRESKKILESLSNEITAVSGDVKPKLLNMIKEIRDNRMATVSEIHQTLLALKDIRKFFLESEYKEEMERLERFVNVCKEIQKLKTDGTFDAVCDSALKLSVKS